MRIILDIIAKLEADLDDPDWVEHAHVAAHRIAHRLREIRSSGDTMVYLREAEVQLRLAGLINDYRERHRKHGI